MSLLPWQPHLRLLWLISQKEPIKSLLNVDQVYFCRYECFVIHFMEIILSLLTFHTDRNLTRGARTQIQQTEEQSSSLPEFQSGMTWGNSPCEDILEKIHSTNERLGNSWIKTMRGFSGVWHTSCMDTPPPSGFCTQLFRRDNSVPHPGASHVFDARERRTVWRTGTDIFSSTSVNLNTSDTVASDWIVVTAWMWNTWKRSICCFHLIKTLPHK